MPKKNFKGGLKKVIASGEHKGINSLIGESKTNSFKSIAQFEQEEKKEKPVKGIEQKTTFVANIEQFKHIKAIAYWERMTIKEIMGLALTEYIKDYDALNGTDYFEKYSSYKDKVS